MKNLRIALWAAAGLAAASVGVATPPAVNLADCPIRLVLGQREAKLPPPGLPKHPPTGALPVTARMPTAPSASISTMSASGLRAIGGYSGHTDAGTAQPESVVALLRQLGVHNASVIEEADILRAWLRDNVPNRELRVSMRQNGYGILLDLRFGRPPRRATRLTRARRMRRLV